MNVLARLLPAFPPGQAIRYLCVGAWNTLFGYALFAAFTWLLSGRIMCAYLWAGLLSNLVAVSVAFLSHKWIVFRTRGNYLREYLRCWAVYGTTTVLGLAALPVLVTALNWAFGPRDCVPYLAGAGLTVGTVVFGFLGHKKYTFTGNAILKPRPLAILEDIP